MIARLRICMQRLPPISTDQIDVPKVSNGCLASRWGDCGELPLSCSRPTSYWHWCDSEVAPISSLIGSLRTSLRYDIPPPFQWFPSLFACKVKIASHQSASPVLAGNPKARAGRVYHEPVPARRLSRLHSLLAADSSLLPGWASPLSRRRL